MFGGIPEIFITGAMIYLAVMIYRAFFNRVGKQ